jgi:hypothetical protein
MGRCTSLASLPGNRPRDSRLRPDGVELRAGVIRRARSHALRHGTGTDSGHAATVDQIKSIVTSNSPGLDSSNVSTAVTFTPDQSTGSTVKVAVTYSFYPITPYIPVGPISMKSTSEMVILQ